MAWQDRPYYRDDRGGLSANPILRALNGSVPLFTAFGIRVRAHAWLIIFIIGTLFLDFSRHYPLAWRALAMSALAVMVILHEFGHCFAARWVGGSAEDILLWPLGGLAFTSPPHRPLPRFLTSAAGPAVNVLLCLICATGVYLTMRTDRWVSLDPFHPIPYLSYSNPALYFWMLYWVSYVGLLFNLLPIFPLDGGQMLQATLWPRYGYFRSMNFATITGMVGGAILIVFGIFEGLNFLLIGIGLFGILECRRRRLELREIGPEDWGYSDSGIDYTSSIYAREEQTPKRKRLSRRAIAQARRIAQREAGERDRIDSILAKVSAHGMASLTWSERRTLHKATERQRQRDVELAKYK